MMYHCIVMCSNNLPLMRRFVQIFLSQSQFGSRMIFVCGRDRQIFQFAPHCIFEDDYVLHPLKRVPRIRYHNPFTIFDLTPLGKFHKRFRVLIAQVYMIVNNPHVGWLLTLFFKLCRWFTRRMKFPSINFHFWIFVIHDASKDASIIIIICRNVFLIGVRWWVLHSAPQVLNRYIQRSMILRKRRVVPKDVWLTCSYPNRESLRQWAGYILRNLYLLSFVYISTR